jgi:hypothetical protein
MPSLSMVMNFPIQNINPANRFSIGIPNRSFTKQAAMINNNFLPHFPFPVNPGAG